MKTQILLGVTLLCALPLCAQPGESAPKLVNGLPFPFVTPARAQELAMIRPLVLEFDKVTLKTALEELQRQSGVRFDIAQGTTAAQLNAVMSLQLETPLFERALQAILDVAGLQAELQDWSGSQNLQLVSGEPKLRPQTSGTDFFKIDLASVATSQSSGVDLRYFDNPRRSQSRQLSVKFNLRPDRRLPIVGKPVARLARAEDEQGRSLLLDADEVKRTTNPTTGRSYYNNSPWNQSQTSVSLRPSSSDSKELAHLEGVIVYALVTKTELWQVPDLLAAPLWARSFSSPEESVQLKVEAVADAQENGVKLTMEVVSSNPDWSYDRIPYPLSQVEPLMAAIRIEDGNGRFYRNSGYTFKSGKSLLISANYSPESEMRDEDGARVRLQRPLQFVLNAPLEVVQTEVPFSFTNVPLP